MTARARGFIISAGGTAWLAGIVVLELMYEESDDSFPIAFPLVALPCRSLGRVGTLVSGAVDRP